MTCSTLSGSPLAGHGGLWAPMTVWVGLKAGCFMEASAGEPWIPRQQAGALVLCVLDVREAGKEVPVGVPLQ